MLKSVLYGYSDTYILAKGVKTVADTLAAAVFLNNPNKIEYLKIVLH